MAQNDLETLRQRLRDQLGDEADEVWSAGEKDDILAWATRQLNYRLPRPLDPEAAAQTITLTSGDYFYAINSGITHVNAVEWVDTASNDRGYIEAWELDGDLISGNGLIHVSPRIVEQGGTLRLHGYGRYALDTLASYSATTAIPTDYVSLVLAMARKECYRRIASDRQRFVQWQVANQVQNISINELLQMISDADRQAEDESLGLKRWQKPVIGRTLD